MTEAQPLSREAIQLRHEEGTRMMALFMPHALRQMKAWYERAPGQTHGRFVHYTSAEAALGIIRSKRFWLRNTNCMSDYREVQHGFDMFTNFFSDQARHKAFVDAFDACTPGVASEAIAAFNTWWADVRLNTYIGCVSEHEDSEDRNGRLSMW